MLVTFTAEAKAPPETSVRVDGLKPIRGPFDVLGDIFADKLTAPENPFWLTRASTSVPLEPWYAPKLFKGTMAKSGEVPDGGANTRG